jgi:hypothetical protein
MAIINKPIKYTSSEGDKFEIVIHSFDSTPGIGAEMLFNVKKDGEAEVLWDYQLKIGAVLSGPTWHLGQGSIPNEQTTLEELGLLKVKIEIENKDKSSLLTPQNSEATYNRQREELQTELDWLLKRKKVLQQ